MFGPIKLDQLAEMLGVAPADLKATIGTSKEITLSTGIQSYVRALRDQAARSSQSVAGKRLQAARTRGLELRNAQADGLVLPVADSLAVFTEAFGALRSNLFGAVVRAGRDLEFRRRVEAEIDRVLQKHCDRIEAGMKTGGAVQ